MGAEFIPAMSDGGGNAVIAEYDVTRLIGGDVETVRARLEEALEQMGFRVINETPVIQAKRNATGMGASGLSSDILEFQRTLTVNLKQTSHNTTRATFDYRIKNAILAKSDRQILTREVDAIIAIAATRFSSSICSSCGSEINTRTRFCRQCGAPTSAPLPAEIESLRLTAGMNSGYKGLYSGTIFVFVAMLLPLILFFLDQDAEKYVKRVRAILIIAGIMGTTGMGMLLNAIWNIRKTLYPRQEGQYLAANVVRPLQMSAPDTNSLAEKSAYQAIPVSVTEDTTNLLPEPARNRETI
ncbi:MAG: hypothetical protein IPO77_08905 [Acidobacteria bacterium]|nr:hypothetical protein [Acidobacteriota bacterium]